MESGDSVFILDIYNKYQSNKDVRHIFTLFGKWYCIRETNLVWGMPEFPEKDFEDDYSTFQLYNTFDEALAAVKSMKKAEAMKF